MKKGIIVFMLSLLTITTLVLPRTMNVEAASIKLNATSLTLKNVRSYTLKVKITSKKVTWTSSNKKVATVSSKGVVKAVKNGTCYIYAKVSGKKLKCKVTVKTPDQKKIKDSDYVRVKDYIPSLYVDLRYATTNNFTKKKIYNFKEAYLRYGTVKKLKKVQEELLKKGYSIKIWDAYRPYAAQKKLWQVCPNSRYVANPNKGPRNHNIGATVDITLVTKTGKIIPMPTDFDNFSAKADRNYSDISNKAAVKNARLLENIMEKYGFNGYSKEWWHYNDNNKSKYKYVNYMPSK